MACKADRVERYVAASRARACCGNACGPRCGPRAPSSALFVAAALFDVFAILPWEIHALIFARRARGARAIALYFSFRTSNCRAGTKARAALERNSTLAHRPITERDDVIAAGAGDAYAEALWRAHIKRLLARIEDLRVALPSPGLGKRDPYALRFVVLFAVVLGFIVAGSDSGRPFDAFACARSLFGQRLRPRSMPGSIRRLIPDEAPIYLGRALDKAVTGAAGFRTCACACMARADAGFIVVDPAPRRHAEILRQATTNMPPITASRRAALSPCARMAARSAIGASARFPTIRR